MAIKWPFKFLAYLTSVAALFGETEQVQHEIKKNISKLIHYRYITALITVHLTVFAVLCSSKFIGRCLKISVNSRSNWLKSEAEHYQHCCQRIKNASPCLCLHKWLIAKGRQEKRRGRDVSSQY